MRRIVWILLLAACAAPPPRVEAPRAIAKQHGLSYAAANPRLGTYGSEASAASLKNARALGADWISVTPFGFQRPGEPLRSGGWENDDAVKATIAQAHALGIRVLLKPHVWIRGGGAIDHDDYEPFIAQMARLARDANADALCIGNELKLGAKDEARWRTIIARVRETYRGPITYGANFDEVFDVPFWDAVDWIGVSGYFPLVDAPSPDRESLVRAWQPIAAQLEALSTKYQKPVLFTEIGYRSADGAAWRQWEIPRNAPLNLDAQRVAYESFFETIWPRPWVLGAYPWKWFSYPNHSGPTSNDYEFENKPAAEVIRRYYTSAATSASSSSTRR
ncbi:MAG TPA: hypothetical protein VHW00_11530 [Thermoanaerobaculia bacterium]|nr:hypothetical protein [Thermoanaerobaculia bacterium]